MALLRPGFIPPTLLKTVAPGTTLLASTAKAFTNLVLVASLYGETIKPASTYGSGYRDWATATVFYQAGQGNKQALAKAHLDPHLHVSIAAPPGSHGGATRIDMLFNGHSPEAKDLALAERYGFTREFGSDDPNHFQHDGRTAISGVRGADKIRLTAEFLNDRHLGKSTQASSTGVRDPEFIWLIQHYGTLEKWYHGPEDGITGPNTEHTFDLIWNYIKTHR